MSTPALLSVSLTYTAAQSTDQTRAPHDHETACFAKLLDGRKEILPLLIVVGEVGHKKLGIIR